MSKFHRSASVKPTSFKDLDKTLTLKGKMKEDKPEGDDLSPEALKKVKDSLHDEGFDLTK
jgi:hypothetical protein